MNVHTVNFNLKTVSNVDTTQRKKPWPTFWNPTSNCCRITEKQKIRNPQESQITCITSNGNNREIDIIVIDKIKLAISKSMFDFILYQV